MVTLKGATSHVALMRNALAPPGHGGLLPLSVTPHVEQGACASTVRAISIRARNVVAILYFFNPPIIEISRGMLIRVFVNIRFIRNQYPLYIYKKREKSNLQKLG